MDFRKIVLLGALLVIPSVLAKKPETRKLASDYAGQGIFCVTGEKNTIISRFNAKLLDENITIPVLVGEQNLETRTVYKASIIGTPFFAPSGVESVFYSARNKEQRLCAVVGYLKK